MTGCSCSTRSLHRAVLISGEKESCNLPKGRRVHETQSRHCHLSDLPIPADEGHHTLEQLPGCGRGSASGLMRTNTAKRVTLSSGNVRETYIPLLVQGRRSRAGGKYAVVSPEKCLNTADNWTPLSTHGGRFVSLIGHQSSRVQNRVSLHHAMIKVWPSQMSGRLASLGKEGGLHQPCKTESPRVSHCCTAPSLLQEACGTIS